jgi:hypothetical protein
MMNDVELSNEHMIEWALQELSRSSATFNERVEARKVIKEIVKQADAYREAVNRAEVAETAVERLTTWIDTEARNCPSNAAIDELLTEHNCRWGAPDGAVVKPPPHRWELRREPDNSKVLVALFLDDDIVPQEGPVMGLQPVIGNVRWYRDGVPYGPILDGFLEYEAQTEQLPSGATITKTE